jgi:hypothetical protein
MLAVIRSSDHRGTALIRVEAEGISGAELTLTIK